METYPVERHDAPADASRDRSEVLKPYVPRLLIEWVRDEPERRHRVVDGSLAFVDISGFTALTERLARRGKIGAELMRDMLDDVFRALLDDAYDRGAGLLKWGGDALLLLFDGPEHAPRAARSAWEMQRTLDRVGRLRVTGSTVRLRMSGGIQSGPIAFFTAGSVHRELLVLGGVATQTVQLESRADAGQIAIGADVARALDPACVTQAEDGTLFLAAPPDVPRERAPDVGPVLFEDVAGCIPVAARAHVLLERSEPEHRTITAAFVELMHTDRLLAELGPDAFADALEQRVSAIQEAAYRYDVPFYETDVGNGSVKALLTGGAPSSTGQDEEHVLRALRDVVEQPGAIPLRVGVNTGKVFTGDFGPPYRRAYRVFGDAINTAARVMSRAEVGQILATDTVLARSRTLFATTPLEPFSVKGKTDPLRASVVGPIEGVRADRESQTPLVGRDLELRVLLALLADVRRGEGRVLEISGASGTGKSRLVAELAGRSPDVVTLRGDCDVYTSSTPYAATRSLFRALLGVEGADQQEVERRLLEALDGAGPALVPLAPVAGVLVGLDLPPTEESARLDERFLAETIADLALRLLDALLGDAPRLLLLEDVEHADAASSDLLRRIVQGGRSRPQLVVVTHTDPATPWVTVDDDVTGLWFTALPLPARHLLEIVGVATEEEPLSAHDVDEIVRRADGNVLFLLELLDAVRAAGSSEALPDSVEAVVAAEIDRLDPADRAVLRYASVVGMSFRREELDAALAGEVTLDEGVWSRLGALVEEDVAGGLRFRNTLVRDVAYEGLPYRRRHELHARVGEAIEAAAGPAPGDDDAAALAFHFFAAQRFEQAWRYCRLAGDRARAVGASVDAARLYEHALAAARRLRDVPAVERAAVWSALGAVRDSAGRFDAAYEALRRATALYSQDPGARVRTYEERARARIRSAAYGRSLRELTSGLRLADSLPPDERRRARARLLAQRAELRLLQGHPREALALAEEAVAEGEATGELEAVARACTALDGAYQMLGEPQKAVHELKAIDIYAQLGRTRTVGIIQMNVGVQAYADGRWDEAIDWYRRSERDCMAAGDRQNAAIAAANLGEVLVSRGLLDEAEETLRQARRVLRGAGMTPYALFAETQLARIDLARGDARAAFDALTRTAREAEAVGHAGIVLEITTYLAAAATAAGEAEQGLALLEDAARAAGDEAVLLSVPIDRVQAVALRALGRLDEAKPKLDHALEGARRQALLYEQLLVLRERAELARAGGSAPDAEELGETDRLAQLLGLDA